MKVKYTDGLMINWTEKELNKIAEIKSRQNREHHPPRSISWDTHEEMVKLEMKQKKIKAIKLLDSCGIDTIIIADVFGIYPCNVKAILRRGR